MQSHRFVVAALATWRLTHLLAEEDGPADVVVRARSHLGEGSLGGLMDCFQCLSVWVAAPLSVALTRNRRPDPVVWLALSGAACLLEQATGARFNNNNNNQEETDHGLLRTEAK
jgi:hypothetical protein